MNESMTEDEAKHMTCCVDPSTTCHVSNCMAWLWVNDAFEFCTMDNRVLDPERINWLKADKAMMPPKPVGDGWMPHTEPRQKDGYMPGVIEQVWKRPRAMRRGWCGRVNRERY